MALLQTRNRVSTLEASSLPSEEEEAAEEEGALSLEEANTSAPVYAGGSASWVTGGGRVGSGWCRAEVPARWWHLKKGGCGGRTRLKVLTYNLFWWNLYGLRGGNGDSASNLIKHNGPYDVMGFQECDDPWRVLNAAGLGGTHDVVPGRHATAIAYDKRRWSKLGGGSEEVAEDRWEQHYGRREVGWVRLRNKASGRVVFAVNHHGPLPVNTGGLCGGEATAYAILKVMGTKARRSDFKLLLGDLNADKDSVTQSSLRRKMHRIAHNWVDAVFASCPGGRVRNLGNGGSDHDAIEVGFRI